MLSRGRRGHVKQEKPGAIPSPTKSQIPLPTTLLILSMTEFKQHKKSSPFPPLSMCS